ncbi:MAG: SLC13 family permease [Desulfovibrionales bacterium]
MKRILVCANPDLNLIDGSSIWSQTITLALAETGMAQIDFLAKSKPQREELFAPLQRHKAVSIINGTDPRLMNGGCAPRLNDQQIAETALKLHCKQPYDIILVRGLAIARVLSDYPTVLSKTWIYLTDIPQKIEQYDDKLRQDMAVMAYGAQRILYQAEGFLRLWRDVVPDAQHDKFSRYSPVIPDIPGNIPPIKERSPRAVYAGKFKRTWNTLEMARLWPLVHGIIPEAELVMIGDKIHVEQKPPDYASQMRLALEQTQAAPWLAGHILDLLGSPAPLVFLFVVGLISTVITLLVSNVGATVLLVPLVVDMAAEIGTDPRLAALVVGLAASNSFILPTHQVNALYMGPGGYTSQDFVKAGIPMSLVFLVVMTAVIGLLY